MRVIRNIKNHNAGAKRAPAGTLVDAVAKQSSLYREIAAEREEILRHKWLLSERAGRDVGFGAAAYDWIAKHRTAWRKDWRKRNRVPASFL